MLDQLGGWSHLQNLVEPIRRIHVSEQYRSGMVRLNAARFGLTAFGYVVDAKTLGDVLKQMLSERCPAITFLMLPCAVLAAMATPLHWSLGALTVDAK